MATSCLFLFRYTAESREKHGGERLSGCWAMAYGQGRKESRVFQNSSHKPCHYDINETSMQSATIEGRRRPQKEGKASSSERCIAWGAGESAVWPFLRPIVPLRLLLAAQAGAQEMSYSYMEGKWTGCAQTIVQGKFLSLYVNKPVREEL